MTVFGVAIFIVLAVVIVVLAVVVAMMVVVVAVIVVVVVVLMVGGNRRINRKIVSRYSASAWCNSNGSSMSRNSTIYCMVVK